MYSLGLRLLFFELVDDLGGKIRRAEHSKGDIAISTLDGRAYYHFTNMLKRMNLPYTSSLFDYLKDEVKLVLTTEKEQGFIPYHKVLTLTEFTGNLDLSKLKIYWSLYGKDLLIIGLDPGKRIGMVAYYGSILLVSRIFNSASEAVDSVSRLLRYPAVKKIIKIGDGDQHVARALASSLYSVAKDGVIIELVDEKGTSVPASYQLGLKRDIGAAMMIAFRPGSRYKPLLKH